MSRNSSSNFTSRINSFILFTELLRIVLPVLLVAFVFVLLLPVIIPLELVAPLAMHEVNSVIISWLEGKRAELDMLLPDKVKMPRKD